MPATFTYSPLNPQNPAESLQTNTRRYARYAETRPLQPLKGLRKPRTATVFYRASVPAGHAYCEVAPSHRALSPATDRQNRSFKALSGKGSAPATPPPFRHTPFRPRPRHTATVWRNLGQHPHRDGTFTFSAKEHDSETGLSYFGSRYYSSDLSIWLSVDPQSDKYPSLSPYVYCANNPVKLVDPNGEEVWIPGLDAKGNVIYTAEDGDNYGTFITQFDCTDANGKLRGREIFAKWFTKSQTKSYNFYYYTQSFGDWLNKYDFRFPKVGSCRQMFLFTVDGKNSEAFEKLFRK